MDERSKEMRFKENNEVIEVWNGKQITEEIGRVCLYTVISAFNGTVDSDAIDYCCRQTGSYCNTDKGSAIYYQTDGDRLIENLGVRERKIGRLQSKMSIETKEKDRDRGER